MTARLILICHASTAAVRDAAFPADEPLDDKGATRAAALAGHLPKADRCWSSPELRTRQTAEALCLNASVQPALRDCDYGQWSGNTFDAVHAREPPGGRGLAAQSGGGAPTAANGFSNCCSGSPCGSLANKPITGSRSS